MKLRNPKFAPSREYAGKPLAQWLSERNALQKKLDGLDESAHSERNAVQQEISILDYKLSQVRE